MRKIAALMCSAFILTATAPGFAQTTPQQKDECLLASQNCANQVDTIQQKIRKLNKEIQKGTKVYTPEELKKLQAKLNEANMMLDDMLQP